MNSGISAVVCTTDTTRQWMSTSQQPRVLPRDLTSRHTIDGRLRTGGDSYAVLRDAVPGTRIILGEPLAMEITNPNKWINSNMRPFSTTLFMRWYQAPSHHMRGCLRIQPIMSIRLTILLDLTPTF